MSDYHGRPQGRLWTRNFIMLAAGICTALLLAFAVPSLASSYRSGSLTVDSPWARETAAGQSAGGAFLIISNKGRQADRLVSATSPAAREVQIHTMSMDGGVMRMRQLKQGIEIPAGKTVELKPGGYHIMLMGLKQPLSRGSSVPLTLTFQKAGQVRVELAVMPVGSSGPGGHGHD